MKIILAGAAGLLLTGGIALAQSPTNSTIEGGQTAPSNSAGMPSAAAPSGQINQGTVGAGTTQTPGDVAARQPTTGNSASASATTPSK